MTKLDVCLANVDAAMKALATPLTFNDFSGQVIYPGLYTADAAMGNTGTLYLSVLEEEGSTTLVPNPTWSFYLGGAFTNGAASKIVFVGLPDDSSGNPTELFDSYEKTFEEIEAYLTTLMGGTGPRPLQWKIIGAATLGVSSYMPGDLKSNGAITVGASAKCGNLEALGAITLGPLSAVGTVRATGALTRALDGTIIEPVYDPAEQAEDDVEGAILACEGLVDNAKLALLGLS
jgi:hypothetical protein